MAGSRIRREGRRLSGVSKVTRRRRGRLTQIEVHLLSVQPAVRAEALPVEFRAHLPDARRGGTGDIIETRTVDISARVGELRMVNGHEAEQLGFTPEAWRGK